MHNVAACGYQRCSKKFRVCWAIPQKCATSAKTLSLRVPCGVQDVAPVVPVFLLMMYIKNVAWAERTASFPLQTPLLYWVECAVCCMPLGRESLGKDCPLGCLPQNLRCFPFNCVLSHVQLICANFPECPVSFRELLSCFPVSLLLF